MASYITARVLAPGELPNQSPQRIPYIILSSSSPKHPQASDFQLGNM